MNKSNRVTGVSYGRNPQANGYFVQTYCNECHKGQE